jgi:hypothetical protein
MYGRTFLTNNNIRPTRVSADGSPKVKVGGATIDWTTVAIPGANVNLPDGSVILAGQAYLRYGQVMTRITASGKFGPYDPAAADGRQTLVRGQCFILDATVTQYKAGTGLIGGVNDHIGMLIEAGEVYPDKILHSGVAAHTLALGPTFAELLAAFPAITVSAQN